MGQRVARAGALIAFFAALGGCTPAAVPPSAAPQQQPRQPFAAGLATSAPSAAASVSSAPSGLAAVAGASSAKAAPPSAVVDRALLPWGKGKLQLGRVLQGEQNPEGPMALDADADGRVWILDQVNSRLVRLDRQGGWHWIPASRTAQELAVDGPGHVWLLDRLVSKNLTRIDTKLGELVQAVPLAGPQDEPWLITALQMHGGELWAEYEHAQLRRVTGSGAAVLEGRPTADNRWLLKALRVPPNRAALAGRQPGSAVDQAPQLAIQAEFAWPVMQLVELGGKTGDRLWLVADLVQLDAEDRPVQRRREALLIDDRGQELRRVELCAPSGPEEQLRSARVGQDGHLYSLCLGDKGVLVQEVAP